MPTLSQKEAREFIAEVREKNGGITAEDREYLVANLPSALRALQSTRRQLADSIKILVDNLYSKDTRFLYELIQNAEDNSYFTATADGEEPFLAFKLYPDKIIIDSNEDGFSKGNIKAICTINKSTKKHSAGYIGEKGIGFKSVFKIARKVHIQSGPFSFAFSHTREDDDDGLGMITPYYEDAEELPMGVRTRMTLTLQDPTKFEELASDFRAIPDTFLMFLSRLQRLTIELHQPDNTRTATEYSKRETKENGLYTTFLAKTTRKGMEESTTEQKYYTMKSDLHGLPFDDARKDKEGHSIDRATVILAFPVDEHDEPILKQQYTYAFLPLRRVGFKFLIQADFVTQANREDVVHSQRNQAVLKGVARAFADAVVVFCNRSSLRYRWMRYLPGDSITHEFWRTLWTLVREKLEQTPLLEPWSGSGLYKPSDLEKLSERFLAEDRSPLLPDIEGAEIYLSPKYTEADFQILERLGTTTLHWSKFVDRLDADLRILGGSKWRLLKNNADWRTRICKALSRAFIENQPSQQKRLRTLALIPLRDGRWVSSASGTKIYFPKTDSIPIPVDLGLDLVCPVAAENVAWADLLSTLSVMSCSQESVISSIHKRYNAATLDNFKLFNAVAHIRYLYWFLPKDHSSLASQVRLANQHGSLLKKDQYLYFPDERDDYSPSKLFKQDEEHPGHPVHYLHEDYLKVVDPKTIHHGRPWMRWLEEIVGVRRIPELRAKGHDGLSKEFQYIVSHRSDRLLGTLKHGWDSYRPQINNVVEGELRRAAVLLENGHRIPLRRTFLPLPKLKQIAAELHIADAYPFVAIFDLLRDEERLKWMFVKDLQVGIEENLDFYLSALETLKINNPALSTTSAGDQLTRIYQNIQSRCSEGLDHVRDMFRNPLIWIHPSNRIDSSWLSTADCVWEGPQWLKSKQCLKLEVYLELEPLFKVFLKTPDAAQVDVVNDLRMLKSHGGDKNAVRSQPAADTQQNIGTTGAPYQASVDDSSGPNVKLQSITAMKAYKKYSFEELRLEDYDMWRKPLSAKTSVCKSEVFAGLEIDEITEEAEKRYHYLWQKHRFPMDDENTESRKALRFTFEGAALVYIPKENAWRPPSQCIWAESNVRIPGNASIADAYPSLETFFTKVLSVSKPTVEMYVDSIKADAKGKASAARIKDTMRLICSLGVGESDFSSLVEAKFLPIKLANGVGGFASASSKDEYVDFAIVENTIHRDAFEGRIVVLDLSLEEIRDTRQLLLAMGLEERFSSRVVKEVTDVRGGSQDHDMTRNLRIKSQAIVRCAFHYAGLNQRQDAALLYRKFKRAMVYVSDGIRRSLQITQDGRRIESASSRADFHFEEAEGGLRLYLPKDEAERDVCFESDLPRRLCTFLGITDPSASGVIGGVFRKDNPVVIDRILEKAGVSQNDCDFAALDEELGASEAESDVDHLVETTSNIRLSTPSSGPRPYTPSGWLKWRERHSGSESADVRDEITPASSYQERQGEAQETAYKRILEHIVNVVRQRVLSGVFESTGVPIESPVATEALPQEIIRTAFATRTQERDFKVGAAGELYMFEYLKGLGLPRFGLENWKSEIRDRVKIHAEYHDLEKYKNRSAIADFEYLDDSGTLTRFLIQKGHLALGLWVSERPLYHIEIKTTTSSNWQEPFFMSKAQERHIRDKRIEDGKRCPSIYMICRIFNLGKGDETGMHVYLDPETKRRNEELEFSTHTWAVKPLTHPTMQVENGIARASAARTAGIVGTTAEKSGDSGTKDAKKESGVPSFAPFGSSATNSVPRSSNWTFGSSTLESQDKRGSWGGGLFGSNLGSSINNASTQPPPRSNLFGKTNSSSTLGIFSSSNGVSPNSDTSKSPSLNLFGSNATSSNSGVPKATPKGGLFGSNSMFANDPTSKASSTGLIFGTTASSDAPKVTFPRTTFSGFGSSNTTTSEAPSAKGLFGTTNDSPSSDSSETPASEVRFPSATFLRFADTTSETPSLKDLFGTTSDSSSSNNFKALSVSSLFGTKPATSNGEGLKSISSTHSLGTLESLPSATTGRLFRRVSSPSDTQTPETTSTAEVQLSSSTTTSSIFGTAVQPSSSTTTTGSTFGTAVQPSSSSTTGFIFGIAAPSTQSGPSQSATSPFDTPRRVFAPKATTPTSHDAHKSKVSKPTANNLFSAPGRETSTSTALSSTSNTDETANTSKNPPTMRES